MLFVLNRIGTEYNLSNNYNGNTMNIKSDEIKVYYNSACPVCNAGISAQKDKMSACAIQWVDVNADSKAVNEISSDLEFVRERLHVLDGNGNLKIGMEAFQAIWQHTSNERWKAKIISLPFIKPLLNAAYNIFAKYLYKWNLKKGHWKK